MIRHYITIAFRSLWNNKFHALLNIIGLAIGVSACLVIYLIVSYELSFNKDIPDGDRIYRIHSQFNGAFSGINRGMPTAAGPYIRDNFKGIEHVAQFLSMDAKVEINEPGNPKSFDRINTIVFTDTAYFKVFPIYHWMAGSPESLSQPGQVVLTASQAEKYFGKIEPSTLIGKEVIYRDSLITHVGGVISNPAGNTDLTMTDFISLPTISSTWLKKNNDLNSWTSINSSTQMFVKVDPLTTLQQLEEQKSLLSKQYNEKNTWARNEFAVQPLSDIHYNPTIGIFDFSRSPAHMPTLLTLTGVALLLLVIAAINFINLETAQALRRAKEVGVRKVLGSSRSRLVTQFLCEGLAVTFIALIIAIPLSEIGLILFAEFIPSGLSLSLSGIIPFLIAVIVIIGVLASAYPAFVLSSFLPVLALKNQASIHNPQSRTALLRKSLIVFQFSFAQILIIATLVISWQIRYVLNKDLGFNKEAVVFFDVPWWENSNKRDALRNELQTISEIQKISLSEQTPSAPGWSSSTLKYQQGKNELSVNVFQKYGDPNYINFYELKLLAGRNLQPSDTVKEVIINETLLRQLGFTAPQEAIGQWVDYGDVKIPIVGVVQNFHIQSLHKSIDPVILADASKEFGCFNIKFNTTSDGVDGIKSGLEKIEAAWKKVYPGVPFKYEFLDEMVRNFYVTEQRSLKLSSLATGLAIFISCLGLFGLASFTALQRTKEIGIRKVMGATVNQIVMLMSKDFIVLVLIAFVLAIPVSIYFLNFWLAEFQFHISLNAWIFIGTAFLSVLIAFGTVGWQTMKAARSNPVDSLKME